MRRKAFERAPLEKNGAFVGQLEARDEVDRRALAGAVGSDQPGDLPRRRDERAVLDSVDAAEVLGQPPDLQRRRRGGCAQAARGAASTVVERSTYRRSGSKPRGLNRRNSTRTRPTIAPRIASRNC